MKKGKTRKSRKTLKGGFYPSIYSGVSSATYLAPFVAKQAYRLWNSRKSRKLKSRRQLSRTRKV